MPRRVQRAPGGWLEGRVRRRLDRCLLQITPNHPRWPGLEAPHMPSWVQPHLIVTVLGEFLLGYGKD